MYRLFEHLCHRHSLIPTASDPYSTLAFTSQRQFQYAYKDWLCASLVHAEREAVKQQQPVVQEKPEDGEIDNESVSL